MAVVIVNSVFLRGVTPLEIEKKLLDGAMKDIKLSEQSVSLLASNLLKSKAKQKNPHNIISYWTEKGVTKKLGLSRAPSNICDWCRRKVPEGAGMGLPIFTPTPTGDVPVVGTYDTWSCMYSDANREITLPISARSHIYADSKRIIEQMFAELFPQKVLHYAPHFSKLLSNGGYMTDEIYDANSMRMVGFESYKPYPVVILDQVQSR